MALTWLSVSRYIFYPQPGIKITDKAVRKSLYWFFLMFISFCLLVCIPLRYRKHFCGLSQENGGSLEVHISYLNNMSQILLCYMVAKKYNFWPFFPSAYKLVQVPVIIWLSKLSSCIGWNCISISASDFQRRNEPITSLPEIKAYNVSNQFLFTNLPPEKCAGNSNRSEWSEFLLTDYIYFPGKLLS